LDIDIESIGIWLLIIFFSPWLVYFILSSVFPHSPILLLVSLPSGLLIVFLLVKLKKHLKGPTQKIEWKKSKNSVEEISSTQHEGKQGLFSSLFGDKKKCDECGTDLIYKSGADSYFCPECQKYRWK